MDEHRVMRCARLSEACVRKVKEQLVGEDMGMALAVFTVVAHALEAEVEARELLSKESLSDEITPYGDN